MNPKNSYSKQLLSKSLKTKKFIINKSIDSNNETIV